MLLWPTEGAISITMIAWMDRWWCAIDQYKDPIPVGSPIADQRGRLLREMIPLLARQSAELLKL